ncbi:Proline iminopeptidase (Partial), partial [Seminavis robusta]
KRSQKSSLVVQAKKAYDDRTYGPFEEGDVGISRDRIGKDGDGSQAFFSLYYRMYNSTRVKDCSIPKTTSKLPLVVLHGGPSLPSQYLYPLVSHLSLDRPIIFYDQLGCGKSDEPKEPQFYSIAHSVADLDTVLTTLGFSKDSRVHLFGHSYGGNLAFEFAKARPQLVQSLLLSNTPANMKQAGDSYDRLAARNPVGFWKERVCSVESPSLDNAMQNSGSVWAGMDVVLDYVASPPPMVDGKALFPSTLVVTCARDFAVESSQGWNSVLQGITT